MRNHWQHVLMGVPGTNKETEKKRKLVSENSNSEKVGVAGNKHFL